MMKYTFYFIKMVTRGLREDPPAAIRGERSTGRKKRIKKTYWGKKAIRRIAVRETSSSRYHGGMNERSSESPPTITALSC